VTDVTTAPPLPDWVTEIRQHQSDAVDRAFAAFDDGADVVFIDAPTGSGKTLIGELVRRELGVTRCLYVCSDKTLQDQFARDFPYAKVLKGKANYPTEYGGDAVTCDDCTAVSRTDACMWCQGAGSCPYQIAKTEAAQADLAVTNVSYLLTEANYVGTFSGFDLIIIDEADVLESVLMGFVQYQIGKHYFRELKLTAPKKGSHKTTWIPWLDDVARRADQHIARNQTAMEAKQLKRWRSFVQETNRVAGELRKDVDANGDSTDEEVTGKWVRDYDTETFCVKPVVVSSYGTRFLWRHAKKFLLMSATVISADEMAESLGIPHDWDVVEVPMTFPVENRPIILAPVADVTYRNQDQAVSDLGYALTQIMDRHPDDRIMVHTVSYQLNRKLYDVLKGHGRFLATYQNAKEREAALSLYLASDNGVLLAPSMERGVDLKGDAARVVVVAKCPLPALGDRRIAARTRLPGGQLWYTVQTVRDIVQMTGRGVRSADDWCTTYILDAQFTKNVWRNKHLLPQWWRDAVDQTQDVRWMMRATAKSVVK